jgi:hypothetical protein
MYNIETMVRHDPYDIPLFLIFIVIHHSTGLLLRNK